MKNIPLVFLVLLFLYSCSPGRRLNSNTKKFITTDAAFTGAQFGISLFDPQTNKYLYDHDGDKYLIPASNTKLFACYAAMKYLGDSITAAYYKQDGELLTIRAAGDPTFLHPDFKRQPLYDFLKRKEFGEIELQTPFESEPLGRGWAWDDFGEGYMAERDPFPMYGNLATITYEADSLKVVPQLLAQAIVGKPEPSLPWDISRKLGGHFFTITRRTGTTAPQKTITLAMEKGAFDSRYLADTLHKPVTQSFTSDDANGYQRLYSQPTDSLLSMMMHRSDNFFAEQTLLMVSQQLLGTMNDRKIVDTLLKTDYAGLPQKPKWVDGSGLSRYNLFTTRDFVWLLNNMQKNFGMDRIRTILPTGGEGTLSSLYKNYAGRIYAKTGTLSNHVALSGFLFTNKNRMLIFSFLVNNQQSPASDIRKGIERWLTDVIERY